MVTIRSLCFGLCKLTRMIMREYNHLKKTIYFLRNLGLNIKIMKYWDVKPAMRRIMVMKHIRGGRRKPGRNLANQFAAPYYIDFVDTILEISTSGRVKFQLWKFRRWNQKTIKSTSYSGTARCTCMHLKDIPNEWQIRQPRLKIQR